MYYLRKKKTILWAKNLSLYLMLLSIVLLHDCIVPVNNFQAIAPGTWRGSLQISPPQSPAEADIKDQSAISEDEGIYIPFLFEVIYTAVDSFYIDILNGEERIRVDHIDFGRDMRIAKDTFAFYFDIYDSYISGVYHEDVMQGYWVRNNRTNYRIPFVAHYSVPDRFEPKAQKPEHDLSGRWETYFSIEDEKKKYPAIGEFVQKDNTLIGTFMTEIGDYRYLEGDVFASQFRMSVFDGAHAFLFTGKVQPDGGLLGTFYSGNHYKTLWEAKKNENFHLPHADSLTYLISPESAIDFSFPNTEGNMISILNQEFSNRPKIIQIMGTWCPNCRDETLFLKEYLEKHPGIDLQVIALAFESYQDNNKNLRILKKYKEKLGLTYPILLAGHRDKDKATGKLPFLNQVISYPTLLFLDAQNKVVRIHTGFTGPATSEYRKFVSDFESTINLLLDPNG